MATKNTKDVKTEAQVEHEEAIPMDELGKHNAVDLAEENVDLRGEAFANDILEIEIQESPENGSLDVITVNVNSINQPMIRGKRIAVKRKYVEALAHSRTTKYRQENVDHRDPSNVKMVAKTVLTYPFVVYSDPAGERGKDWLRAILAQR